MEENKACIKADYYQQCRCIKYLIRRRKMWIELSRIWKQISDMFLIVIKHDKEIKDIKKKLEKVR